MRYRIIIFICSGSVWGTICQQRGFLMCVCVCDWTFLYQKIKRLLYADSNRQSEFGPFIHTMTYVTLRQKQSEVNVYYCVDVRLKLI